MLTVKLNKKDVVKIIDDTLTLFRTGIKSEKTRETYEKRYAKLSGSWEINSLESNNRVARFCS